MGLLTIDLGNTNLTWGRFDGDRLVAHGALSITESWEFPVDGWQGVTDVAVASVQREAEAKLRDSWAWPAAPELVFLEQDRPIPVTVDVEERRQVGTDRLVNCLAWHHRSHRPAVIVDFGTAVTFDVVSASGGYRGGLILPGPAMLAGVLHAGTSLLPSVEATATPAVYGRDTRTCIQRGVYGLMIGGVVFHVQELRKVLAPETVFVATGGAAPTFAPLTTGIELVLPFLTLDGIRIAYEHTS